MLGLFKKSSSPSPPPEAESFAATVASTVIASYIPDEIDTYEEVEVAIIQWVSVSIATLMCLFGAHVLIRLVKAVVDRLPSPARGAGSFLYNFGKLVLALLLALFPAPHEEGPPTSKLQQLARTADL